MPVNTRPRPSRVNDPKAIYREGPFPCRGASYGISSVVHTAMTEEQHSWMVANKRIYYTGNLRYDLVHLPAHLRHV